MASTETAQLAVLEVLDEKKEFTTKPITIYIPTNLKYYNINLKYLAAVYQEILLDTCSGKVSESELEHIAKISTELISQII